MASMWIALDGGIVEHFLEIQRQPRVSSMKPAYMGAPTVPRMAM